MIGITFHPGRSFFDPNAVLSVVDRERQGVLSRAGAFVRRDAKGSIRQGKKPSKPGKPPHSHTGELADRIFFAYDAADGAVVIGPEKLNQVYFDGDGQPLSGPVPEVLEEGGDIQVLEVWLPRAQKWVRADLRSRRKLAGRKTRLRRIHIEARPFMGPALAKNRDKFPSLWSDVITP
jgi:hypothetical protein